MKKFGYLAAACALALLLSGCGSDAVQETAAAGSASAAETQASPAVWDYPAEISLRVGTEARYTVPGELWLDSEESTLTACTITGEKEVLTFDRSTPALPEEGTYCIYSMALNGYLACRKPAENPASDGMGVIASADGTALWQLEASGSGWLLRSREGYLAYSLAEGLHIAAEGSVFEFQASTAEGYSGSYGVKTCVDGTWYRFDNWEANTVNVYSHSDNGTYPHTSWFLYRVTEYAVESSTLTFTVPAAQDYTLSLNGQVTAVHGLSASGNIDEVVTLTLNHGETLTVAGSLPDGQTELISEGGAVRVTAAEDGITFLGRQVGTDELTVGRTRYLVRVIGESALLSYAGTARLDAASIPADFEAGGFSTEYITVTSPESGVLEFRSTGALPADGETAKCLVEAPDGTVYTGELRMSADSIALLPGQTLALPEELADAASLPLSGDACVSFTTLSKPDPDAPAEEITDSAALAEGDCIMLNPSGKDYQFIIGSIADGRAVYCEYGNSDCVDADSGLPIPRQSIRLWQLTDGENGTWHLRSLYDGEYLYSVQEDGTPVLCMGAEIPDGAASRFRIDRDTENDCFVIHVTGGTAELQLDHDTSAGAAVTASHCYYGGFRIFRAAARLTAAAAGEQAGIACLFDGESNIRVTVGEAKAEYLGQSYADLGAAVQAAAADTDRICDRVVTLLSDSCCMVGELPAGVTLDMSRVGGPAEPVLTYTAAGEDGSSRYTVYPQITDGTVMLYLPSAADVTALNLHLPAGTVLTASSGASLTTAENDAPADLTALFGSMDDIGGEYALTIDLTAGAVRLRTRVTLMTTRNTASLYLTLDSDMTDPLAWINNWLVYKSDRTIRDGHALMLSANGTEVLCDTDLKEFHTRGNSVFGDAESKPSYALKLTKKRCLAGTSNAKSWVLASLSYANRDTTTYSTAVGFSLYARLNMVEDGDYAVAWQPADLYINGEYRGMYIIMDKINDDRVDITDSTYTVEPDSSFAHIKADTSPDDPAIQAGIQAYIYAPDAELAEGGEGGFIVEISSGFTNRAYNFRTRRGTVIEIREPDCPTREQVQQIAMFYQAFEDALYSDSGYNSAGQYYADMIDLTSWARMFLVKGFMQDVDMLWSSTYMYIDADASGFTSRLRCCTLWDFDASVAVTSGGDANALFSNEYHGETTAVDYKWRLMAHSDFVEELARLDSQPVFAGGTKNFRQMVEDLCREGGMLDEYYQQICASMAMNCRLYPNNRWKTYEEGTIAGSMRTKLLNHLADWEALWEDPNTLTHVTVTVAEDGTLTADAPGASSVSWYRIGSDEPVARDTLTFRPDSAGTYYAAAEAVRSLTGDISRSLTGTAMYSAPVTVS